MALSPPVDVTGCRRVISIVDRRGVVARSGALPHRRLRPAAIAEPPHRTAIADLPAPPPSPTPPSPTFQPSQIWYAGAVDPASLSDSPAAPPPLAATSRLSLSFSLPPPKSCRD